MQVGRFNWFRLIFLRHERRGPCDLHGLFLFAHFLIFCPLRGKNIACYERKDNMRLSLLLFIDILKGGPFGVAQLESKFQKDLMDEIRREFPGCVILKNDSSYIQGIPDWTILYKDKWAVLEAKRSENARKQPNQEYYVDQMDSMSFSRFVYPENKEEVLNALHTAFES